MPMREQLPKSKLQEPLVSQHFYILLLYTITACKSMVFCDFSSKVKISQNLTTLSFQTGISLYKGKCRKQQKKELSDYIICYIVS